VCSPKAASSASGASARPAHSAWTIPRVLAVVIVREQRGAQLGPTARPAIGAVAVRRLGCVRRTLDAVVEHLLPVAAVLGELGVVPAPGVVARAAQRLLLRARQLEQLAHRVCEARKLGGRDAVSHDVEHAPLRARRRDRGRHASDRAGVAAVETGDVDDLGLVAQVFPRVSWFNVSCPPTPEENQR
jgi:hypothetical protein